MMKKSTNWQISTFQPTDQSGKCKVPGAGRSGPDAGHGLCTFHQQTRHAARHAGKDRASNAHVLGYVSGRSSDDGEGVPE